MQNEYLKVLIVDDSEIIGTRVRAMLAEIDGLNIVGQVKEAKNALQNIQQLQPHVVILDISLGSDNGADLLVNIRKQFPDIMVVMLSNFSYPYYRKLCKDRGADFFFDKTTEFENILGLMKQIVT